MGDRRAPTPPPADLRRPTVLSPAPPPKNGVDDTLRREQEAFQRGFVAGAIAYDKQRSHFATVERDCDVCTEYKAAAIKHVEYPRASGRASGGPADG